MNVLPRLVDYSTFVISFGNRRNKNKSVTLFQISGSVYLYTGACTHVYPIIVNRMRAVVVATLSLPHVKRPIPVIQIAREAEATKASIYGASFFLLAGSPNLTTQSKFIQKAACLSHQ